MRKADPVTIRDLVLKDGIVHPFAIENWKKESVTINLNSSNGNPLTCCARKQKKSISPCKELEWKRSTFGSLVENLPDKDMLSGSRLLISVVLMGWPPSRNGRHLHEALKRIYPKRRP